MRNAILQTLIILVTTNLAHADLKKSKNKIQEITFSDMDIKGNARTPDGAYLVQRRGLRFLPIYQVKQDFDTRIRESVIQMK
jgi:hypothetical protein